MAKANGNGTKDSPWALKTPPGTAEYEAYRDEEAAPRRSSFKSERRSFDIIYAASRICTRCW